jgi:peroxiredoxin
MFLASSDAAAWVEKAFGSPAASDKVEDNGMKFKPGDIVPSTTLKSVTGEPIKLSDPNRLVHLQFRRFVDCPICNTHIAELRGRVREIEAAGVKEVIVFHSSAESIRSYQKNVPFVLVGDPKKALYKDFGVETSLGFMTLKALGAGMRGMAHGHFGLRVAGGPLGLPADFLIAPSGQIKAVKYGTHAYDQWSVDELIALAKGAVRAA